MDEPSINGELKSGFDGGKARVGDAPYNWAQKRSQKSAGGIFLNEAD